MKPLKLGGACVIAALVAMAAAAPAQSNPQPNPAASTAAAVFALSASQSLDPVTSAEIDQLIIDRYFTGATSRVRGVGLSDRTRGFTIESRMDDLRAVLDAEIQIRDGDELAEALSQPLGFDRGSNKIFHRPKEYSH